MCRHLVYLGPPTALAALLFDPPHSLAHQSWAPADMRGGGRINADGFGVGWYPDPAPDHPATADPAPGHPAGADPTPGHPAGADPTPGHPAGADLTPVRYRSSHPLWSDPTLPALATTVRSGAVLAAARSATVGMPVTSAAAAPFGEGRWLFSHNGRVVDWPDSVADLAAALPIRELLTLDAPTDSALLWALLRHRLRSGAGPVDAVVGLVADVSAAAPGSRLNLLLTDGRVAVATTLGHSLSVRATAASVVVASEPLDDDPAWTPVPDGHLVRATATEHRIRPMGAPR